MDEAAISKCETLVYKARGHKEETRILKLCRFTFFSFSFRDKNGQKERRPGSTIASFEMNNYKVDIFTWKTILILLDFEFFFLANLFSSTSPIYELQ